MVAFVGGRGRQMPRLLILQKDVNTMLPWYLWVIIGWAVCGFIALALAFRDTPSMRLNVGLKELWPTALGPIWLMVKLWEFSSAGGAR